MTENLHVDVRLRPIRFAFLVRPDDAKSMQKIFEINTCLWGGKFNPIIPYLERVPRWWDRHGHKFDNAQQIMNGYLDFFEPDFLVEAEKGLAKDLGYEKERVLKLSDVLNPEGKRERTGTGLDVFDIYRDLYKKEFQFKKRHPDKIGDISSSEKSFKLFSSGVFGAFPESRGLKYFYKGFKEAFEPEEISLNEKTVEKIYKTRYATALRIGCENIEVDYNDHSDLTFFILDASQPRDMMDFWNLRCVQKSVIAIPVQWIEKLSPFI